MDDTSQNTNTPEQDVPAQPVAPPAVTQPVEAPAPIAETPAQPAPVSPSVEPITPQPAPVPAASLNDTPPVNTGVNWKMVNIILIVLIVIAASALFFYFRQNNSIQNSVAPTPEPTTVIVRPTDFLPDNQSTSSSKITNVYTDTYFFIKYPTDWKIQTIETSEATNHQMVISKNEYQITIFSNIKGIGGVAKKYPSTPITLDGLSLYELQGDENVVDKTKSIFIADTTESSTFKKNGITYSIALDYPTSKENTPELTAIKKEFHSMLAEFRFIQ